MAMAEGWTIAFDGFEFAPIPQSSGTTPDALWLGFFVRSGYSCHRDYFSSVPPTMRVCGVTSVARYALCILHAGVDKSWIDRPCEVFYNTLERAVPASFRRSLVRSK
jgi:hypothetical protein